MRNPKATLTKQAKTMPARQNEIPIRKPKRIPLRSRIQLAGIFIKVKSRKLMMVLIFTSLSGLSQIMASFVYSGMMMLFSKPLNIMSDALIATMTHRYRTSPKTYSGFSSSRRLPRSACDKSRSMFSSSILLITSRLMTIF